MMLRLFGSRHNLTKYQLQKVTVLINLCNQHFLRLSSDVHYRLFTSAVGDSGSKGVDIESFKQKILEKHFIPETVHLEHLEKKFPTPKKLIDELYEPFIAAENSRCPELRVTKALKDKIYKAKIEFYWPAKTSVTGVHTDEETSVDNAYLQACDLFQSMGLIQMNDCKSPRACTTDDMIKLLEKLAEKQNKLEQMANYRVTHCLKQLQDESLLWDSSLQVTWPVCFTVTSSASSINLAYHQTCLLAAMKFKSLGYLDARNNLNKGILISLERYDIPYEQRSICNPDFEIFVDSSKIGMGAYLLTKDDEKIRWISDPWVKDKLGFDPKLHSTAGEFYALVTACYTWRHKFSNKKVLCYSDCKHSINLVNNGLYAISNTKRQKQKGPYHSLYMLLSQICYDNNITLVGIYVPRIDNIAADMLSRCDVKRFKEMVPTAHDNPKKSKKLWFCKSKENNEDNDEDKTPKKKK